MVDGSVYSESVCNHAAWMAAKTGWSVKLYHVMDRRDDIAKQDLSGAIRLGARSALLEQLSDLDTARAKLAREHGRAILEDAKSIILSRGDITVESRLRQGDLVETITAKEEKGDLIVIGKRGEAAGQARAHLGSNLERILRASNKPVLIANHAFEPIEKLVVAFDGGASAMKALDYIAQNPIFADMTVSLVYAGRDAPEIRRAFAGAVSVLEAGGLKPDVVVEQGEPEAVLAATTAQAANELLVMGAYGHSRVRALIIGSTTTAVIRSCKCPVLIMR
ncbi:MAG: universal stress protein [Pseudomonadota bacterium]